MDASGIGELFQHRQDRSNHFVKVLISERGFFHAENLSAQEDP